jgi:hypothetical protein
MQKRKMRLPFMRAAGCVAMETLPQRLTNGITKILAFVEVPVHGSS